MRNLSMKSRVHALFLVLFFAFSFFASGVGNLEVSGVNAAGLKDVEGGQPEGAIHLKFDFGGMGASDGYIGVSGSEGYDAAKGYGFNQPANSHDVEAGGEGACSDAVAFDFGNAHFKVDLPVGVYKITVTTGNDISDTIEAEDVMQLLFMEGRNAVDSFTIPVTDGQLNIYASYGVGAQHSISILEIEQVSTGTETKPTIWLCGDSTVCNYYNVSDSAARGWGEYLKNYIDTDTYDIRNDSVSGMRTANMVENYFKVVEKYGKEGDILVLSLGINDYVDELDAYNKTGDPIESANYVANMTTLVQKGKERGMTVYLVKQHGDINECRYPVPEKEYFSDELDAIAASEGVGIINMFKPWLQFCLEKSKVVAETYYASGVHPNAKGADKLAEIAASQLFPTGESSGPVVVDPYTDFDSAAQVAFETVESGEAISNPHKGYVMTVYNPNMLYEGMHEYGIGGINGNEAWNLTTICSDVLFWKDLNPQEDVYNFEKIDKMLEACEHAGMTYGMRIIPYTTCKGTDDNYGADHDFVPQWVYDKGAKKDTVTYTHKKPSPTIKVPNWSDPIYIASYKKFIAALADKYNGDPRVEYMEIRAFGNMGEWHTGEFVGNDLPTLDIQKDMLSYIASQFTETTCSVFVDARDLYDYANDLGFVKRNNGLIMAKNTEWELVPSYRAGVMTMADSHSSYEEMLKADEKEYLRWTPERYRESIEIAHLSIFAFDQESTGSYKFYKENKELCDEMCNRLGYNFTVTYAKRAGNKLKVTIKNTGLAPAFFNIDLCAEITDESGNKIENFGEPIRIAKGSFGDGDERSYMFEFGGTLESNATICLAMYESKKFASVSDLVNGKENPTVRFDNKNNMETKRLKLVETWRATDETGNGAGNVSAKKANNSDKNTKIENDSGNNAKNNNGSSQNAQNNKKSDNNAQKDNSIDENSQDGEGDSYTPTKLTNEWYNGKWYNADGTQTYEGIMSWKCNSTGWWLEDTFGWYPVSCWQKIDGLWYYFDSEGYMAENEWRDGYWLSGSGAWTYEPIGSWGHNSKGWWYGDTSGWYAYGQWQKINGIWYYFNNSGYWVK